MLPQQLGSRAGGDGDGGGPHVDRLSTLPECVLLHILTFLPPIDAVRTSLIGPRFRYLWAFLPSLCFVDWDDSWGFVGLVNSMLLLYQGDSIDTFRLGWEVNLFHTKRKCSCDVEEDEDDDDIHDDDDFHDEHVVAEKMRTDAVITWLLFALRKNVKCLHLKFSMNVPFEKDDAPAKYPFPVDVLSKGTCLRELNLEGCRLQGQAAAGGVKQLPLPSLKTLVLSDVVVDDVTMHRILRGCPALEEMSLVRCHGLTRLAFINPRVKSLKLRIVNPTRIKISCPNIESLYLSGDLSVVDLLDVSSLAAVSLSLGNPIPLVWTRFLLRCHLKLKKLFEKLSHCNSFTVLMERFRVLNVFQQVDLSSAWKYVKLQLNQKEWNHLGMFNLLTSSPSLETVEIHIYHKRPSVLKLFDQARYHPSGEFWSSQEGTLHCLQHHLKTVRIHCDVIEPYLMEFIEFLLKNAKVLEKLVVSTKESFQPTNSASSRGITHQTHAFSTEQKIEVRQKLCSLPRASECAVVDFS